MQEKIMPFKNVEKRKCKEKIWIRDKIYEINTEKELRDLIWTYRSLEDEWIYRRNKRLDENIDD